MAATLALCTAALCRLAHLEHRQVVPDEGAILVVLLAKPAGPSTRPRCHFDSIDTALIRQ